MRAGGLSGGEGFAQEIFDDGELKAGDEIERGLVAESAGILPRWFLSAGIEVHESLLSGFRGGAHCVQLDVAEDGGFKAGEAEEKLAVEGFNGRGDGSFGARCFAFEMRLGFDPGDAERNREWVAEVSQMINPRATGVTEAEQLGDLVEGLACGVVEGAPDELVTPGTEFRATVWRVGEKEVSVTAGDDESEGGHGQIFGLFFCLIFGLIFCLLPALFEEDGVDVSFEVVDGDEGLREREGERLGVAEADQERTGESRAAGDGNGVEVAERDARLSERGAGDGDDVAEMFAAGEFGNYAAVGRMGDDLRGDNRRERTRAALDDGGGGFVAGAFDAEDQATPCSTGIWKSRSHDSSVSGTTIDRRARVERQGLLP